MHENKLFYERRSHMETGLQGQLKKSQLPYIMGDLFPKGPEADHPWWWKDSDIVSMIYLTPEAAAAAVLPSECSLPPSPVEGLTGAVLVFAKYRGGTLDPYNEVVLQIPCLYRDQPCLYIPAIYVTTDKALVSGRELFGFPKKLATIELDSSGAQFTGSLECHGVRAASISFKQGNTLFSVPLPAREKVVLPPPFDQLLVLPEPTGSPQGLPFSVLTTRFIPEGIAPQHIESLWKWEQGAVFAGEGSIEYDPSDAEPLAKLPVVGVFASMLFRGDMACYGGQVLTEMA
jgi:acetoacetate decarboxylase